MNISINIPEKECVYVERLWYEYNAALGILRYLMSQPDTLEKHLQLYVDSCEAKGVALEIAKQEVSDKYKPEGKVLSYSFNFDKLTIDYQMEE